MRKVNYIKLLLTLVFIIGSLTACGGGNSDGEITYDSALVTDSSVFNCPTEDIVINALQGVASIDEIMAVTENHDPNDGLNKTGGYSASVYFSIPSVNDTSSNDDIVDRGVDSGGCIEVYTTRDDANKRADKLKSLQKLHAGGYVVLETTVIRLSYKMNESQWSNLTNGIITSFMNPPEKIELSVEDETTVFETEEDITTVAESEMDETENVANELEQEYSERTLFTTSKVNIREMPNTDCDVLGKVEAGQEVIEYEAGADGWSKVVCGGLEGYIKSEYLTQDAPSTSTVSTEQTSNVETTESAQNTTVSAQETTAVVASAPETPVVPETPVATETPVVTAPSGGTGAYVVNGKNGKIHIVGGCSTPPTEQPIYVNSYEEAEAESIRIKPSLKDRRCGNCY